MSFWKRLRTYLVGVGLGLLLTYIFFGDRDFSYWTPEGRVLVAIDSSERVISEKAKCQLTCLGIQVDAIDGIMDSSEVDFSESNTRKKPCPVYILKSAVKKGNYRMVWEVCEFDEKATLKHIERGQENCSCS